MRGLLKVMSAKKRSHFNSQKIGKTVPTGIIL